MDELTTDLDHKKTQALLKDLVATQDFPLLSQTIVQVNEIVGSETSQADELTRTILRDVSLTNKLLRLVNAAHYNKFAGQPVSTISRAVVILGFNTVRDVALSLMLFDHLQNHAQARQLKGEVLESYYCGVLGRLLGKRLKLPDVEEAFISAMFRNVGRLMARFYFYDRTLKVNMLMRGKQLSENDAAREVFGTTYDQIGLSIARHWHLPETLIQGMTPLPPGDIGRPDSDIGRLRAAASLARELYEVIAAGHEPREQSKLLNQLGRRYATLGSFPGGTLNGLAQEAAREVQRDADIFQSDLRASPALAKLLDLAEQPAGETAESEEAAAIAQALNTLPILAAVEPEADDPASMLAAGLTEMTEALVGGASISDVLHMMLEIFYRTGAFDRVMIAVRDKDGKSLTGRFGFGKDIDKAITAYKVPLTFAHDAFQVAANQGVDILIGNVDDEALKSRIPDWQRQRIRARSFLLLPLVVDNKTLALLYADRDKGTLQLDSKMLNMLKVLRNQALLAMRQNSNK
ncbi:HDOD domain-containing protein [Sulfuritortus calidifontis]|uniref:HDOD domain-containing protein n=1 Tax=Sulfuritortus calidifontis TaxID=1914471 RepID=A0A4R3JWB3_9PROT|nr:HDOD domain-containing protein [Sulfuritortus calidifontis]TCS72439.1 HDOD domain-containing protein [Sulfuritortus calidifontis]